jgi:DNA-binding response OmpR family regulator
VTKVFLIEDDPTMLELLTTLLGFEGFDVFGLAGGEDVLAEVKYNQPDLIIIDIHLRIGGGKEINGIELLHAIRSDFETQNKKVIMSSGVDMRLKCKEAGADGFLLKPYMPDELINMIKEIIE